MQTQLVLEEAIRTLERYACRLLRECTVKADDGTVLYTPAGGSHYRALWVRDFTYMVEYAGELVPAAHVEACIHYLLGQVREDGAPPDRVLPNGAPVYAALQGLVLPNIDNAQFLAILVDEHLAREASSARRAALLQEWAPALDRVMDYIPRSAQGLVQNDPFEVHSTYGFTDTIGKTGELFMESLLYWTASQRLARWHEAAGDDRRAAEYRRRATQIAGSIHTLWSDEAGAFYAATNECRQLDVWGNAYAIYLDFPLGPRRARVLDFLVQHYDRYVWRGQVRHLLAGEYWERILQPNKGYETPDRYQNGAYWATASGWVIWALAQVDQDLALQALADLLDDFQKRGVYECVAAELRGPTTARFVLTDVRRIEDYVTSATNPLGAVRRLASHLASREMGQLQAV
jgi:hypothetical protein